MKVLLDECVDWRLLRDLVSHEVVTVKQRGWSSVSNGALLALAAAEFDAFITVDARLPDQQEISRLPLSVIVLRGRTTKLADLRDLVPQILHVLQTIGGGEVRLVSWRETGSATR